MSHHAFKTCYCHTCDRAFHYLGIARHTAMHREKREVCKVTYTNGDTYTITPPPPTTTGEANG
jgi:hypothetical protein